MLVECSILKRYNKGTNIDQIRAVFKLCREFGIRTLAYFILGLPGEDNKSIRRTIKFAKEIKCDYASFGYASPDIGTELREESIKNGWIMNLAQDRIFDSSAAPILRTNELSGEETKELLRAAYRQFYIRPSYIIKRLLETKSLGDVRFLLKGGCLLFKRNIL